MRPGWPRRRRLPARTGLPKSGPCRLFREAFGPTVCRRGRASRGPRPSGSGSGRRRSGEAIVAALDEWDELAGNPKNGVTEPHRAWLRAVLAAAEPEDGWDRQVRAARAEKDPAKRRRRWRNWRRRPTSEKLPARA